jgi:hypothetical protein
MRTKGMSARPILRFARSHWVACTVGSMIAILLVIRLAWGWHADRLLAEQDATMRALGLPVERGEITMFAVPDEDNAWTIQSQAAGRMTAIPWLDLPGYLPPDDEWLAAVSQAETVNPQVFGLIRPAMERRQAFAMSSMGAGGGSQPHLLPCRHLGELLTNSAVLRHLNGEHGEALRRLRDALHLSRTLRNDPALVSQILAARLDNHATHAVLMIAPGLPLNDPQVVAQMRPLIEELLEEATIWEGMRRAQAGEWMSLKSWQFTMRTVFWLFDPLEKLNCVRGGRALEVQARLATPGTTPAQLRAELATIDRRPDTRNFGMQYARLAGSWGPVHDSIFFLYLSALGDRRAAAISLAAQLYRHEHGQYPPNLSALCPQYLLAVPLDSADDARGEMGYTLLPNALPDGGDRPLVSFRSNRGINPDELPTHPVYSYKQAGKGIMQYRDLARWTPVPSTQAVDNEPDIPDAPWQEP